MNLPTELYILILFEGSFFIHNQLTAKYCGPNAPRPLNCIHRLDVICCIFFCSFSFCVSAILTTNGEEQPCKDKTILSKSNR